VRFKPVKLAPALITVGVIALVCGLRLLRLDFLERLERIFYDQRVRLALHFPQPVATNLAAVVMTDQSIHELYRGLLGKSYGLAWPRHVYGRLVRELSTQKANTVGFDILFSELRPDNAPLPVSLSRWPSLTNLLAELHPDASPTVYKDQDGEPVALVESDDYFAMQTKRAENVVVAASEGVLPQPLFATNAVAVGDISADADTDGVLRRARAFRDYRIWSDDIIAATADTPVDIAKTKVESHQIQFLNAAGQPVLDTNDKPLIIPLNEKGEMDIRPYLAFPLNDGESTWRKPFVVRRVWHMGIVLAAQELKLDLPNASIDLDQGRITFSATNGVVRVLPVDENGYFPINWELTAIDQRLPIVPIEDLLKRDVTRSLGGTNAFPNDWRNKIVIVGSTAVGNNLTDRGATPLEKNTFLVSKHWNVANSLLTGRFVQRTSLGVDVLLVIGLVVLTALLSWQLRVLTAALSVLALAVGYLVICFILYIQFRIWLPLALPLIGSMIVEYGCLVSYRVLFEQAEQRRVKSLFSQVVSPNIVNVLLEREKPSLEGARQEVTVFFADVRGFTELTDANQDKAEAFVRNHKLAEKEATEYFDEEARETLNTVNFYLALVADTIKKHDGTLDKYIGDCVMAFWGAPTPNPKHALACVRAAIEAQRSIDRINQARDIQRTKLEIENRARESAGLRPKPVPPSLSLGTGINTGKVTVGLMGSEAHIRNYTVFGREVNLANRLESFSGHGRIIISETTYQHLLRDDAALAATCTELQPFTPKGFKRPIRIYQVPWKTPEELKDAPKADPSYSTTFETGSYGRVRSD
jgi:class 3 adenylate cyclase/CHASE2 domain-containing sensor protein